MYEPSLSMTVQHDGGCHAKPCNPAVYLCFLVCSSRIAHDSPWAVGTAIVPKKRDLCVYSKPGGHVVARADDIDWWSEVEEVRGQWVRIEDEGLISGREDRVAPQG